MEQQILQMKAKLISIEVKPHDKPGYEDHYKLTITFTNKDGLLISDEFTPLRNLYQIEQRLFAFRCKYDL